MKTFKASTRLAYAFGVLPPMFATLKSLKRCCFVFIGACLFVTSLHAAEPRRKVVLASSFASPGTLLGTWSELVLRDAFGRMGLDYEQRTFPAMRAEMLAVRGDVDGETLRPKGYGDGRPSLLRVAHPYQWDSFSAYAVRDIPLEDGWNSLANTNMRVNIRLGATHPEKELKERVPSSLLETTPNATSGLRKLLANYSDIYIELETSVQALLGQAEFQGTGIRKIAEMEKLDGYCYLHTKNQNLLVPLSNTLASMRKDGSLERHRKQAVLIESGR
jgi:polar amino acid transport system substrate-binding protein